MWIGCSRSNHESVYEELVESKVKEYADGKNKANPSKLRIFFDSELTENEKLSKK